MNDDDLLRYSRHILLDEFGVDGQQRVSAGRALIVGAGGLGSPVALYLAGAGVGTITLVDDDTVDLTNLQRQLAHTSARIGHLKVASAAQAMREINPCIDVRPIAERADATRLDALVANADVVIDCSDNFATRQAINRACVAHAKPLVAGASIRFDGQLSVFDTRDDACPCYACIFPPEAQFEETRCAVMGVFSPVVGTIGALQAGEALKLLAGMSGTLTAELLIFDGRTTRFDRLRISRDPQCPVCAGARKRRV
ncbi:MAG: molybdopterin-synthase adenylyltransferase MoeB [Burkholderiaceae bacterium]|jgi:molybdopterin/thiamine biosynthesis adenylyltransferase|nr:molybdopterin-synthase adenylyltransferase MoeB [Burkholderiaceae bacterium]